MSYTDVWSTSTPTGSEAANTIKTIIRNVKLDIQERLMDIFSIPDFTVDPVRPYGIKFTDNAIGVISLGDNTAHPRALSIKNHDSSVTYVTFFDDPSISIVSGALQLNANTLKFNESGVRAWSAGISSGGLSFTSGDGLGVFYFDKTIAIGPTQTFTAGEALRLRANSSATGTVEGIRSELHMTSGVTGSKYGLEATVYSDHTSGTLQRTKGVVGTAQATGVGGTTTDIIGLESNVLSTGGTVTNATGFLLVAPSASGGGSIVNAIGINIGNVTVGSSTNFAIQTGLGLVQFGDQLIIAASTTTRSGFRFTAGSAPTVPVLGDAWLQGTSLKFFDGTTTKTFTLS